MLKSGQHFACSIAHAERDTRADAASVLQQATAHRETYFTLLQLSVWHSKAATQPFTSSEAPCKVTVPE